ncbi:Pr6Pr family membrane protein [Williamsia sp.]|uniref:Pr6Pr family membrane protein n=1 Tax=Williamsia sp. TaxID=1872085 RepID=UPI002F9276E8
MSESTRAHGVTAFKLILGALALSALVTEIVVLIDRESFDAANFFSYFTVLSNLLMSIALLVSAGFLLTGRSIERLAMFRGAATLYMLITGIGFTVLLSGLESTQFTAVGWDNTVLHYLVPVGAAIDWLIDPPAVAIRTGRAMIWLIFPLAYVVYSEIRGPIVDWYPYPFLDPGPHGVAAVVVVSIGIALLAAALAFALAWYTRFRVKSTGMPGPGPVPAAPTAS